MDDLYYYKKRNFPMKPGSCELYGLSVCFNFLKGREDPLPCLLIDIYSLFGLCTYNWILDFWWGNTASWGGGMKSTSHFFSISFKITLPFSCSVTFMPVKSLISSSRNLGTHWFVNFKIKIGRYGFFAFHLW